MDSRVTPSALRKCHSLTMEPRPTVDGSAQGRQIGGPERIPLEREELRADRAHTPCFTGRQPGVAHEWGGEMLRAVPDLRCNCLHPLAEEEQLSRPIHSTLAHERIPGVVVLGQDALQLALAVAEFKRGAAEAQISRGDLVLN